MKPRSLMFRCISCVVLMVMLSGTSIAQYLESAVKLTRSEQFEEAEKIFEQLISREPNNGINYFYFGDNYLQTNFTDSISLSLNDAISSANALFIKGTQSDPNSPLCYVGLGKTAILSDDVTKANSWFDQAIAKFPSKANKTSTVTKDIEALTWARIAEAWIASKKSRNIAGALSSIRKGATIDSALGYKNPMIYIIYGDVHLENNDGSKAILMYKKAQDMGPNSPTAKLRLGKLWVRAKNWPEAINYYKEAIGIDSTFAPAYRELGTLYMRAGQFEKSREYFKKYLELANSIFAKRKYASVLWELKEYVDCILIAKEILAVDPTMNDLNRVLAYCYFETSKYDTANVFIERFFNNTLPEKIIPSDYSYFGKILSKIGRDSLAIENFQKAIDLDSSNYDLYSDIANSFNRLKNYTEAARYYEIKLSKPSDKSPIPDYYRLGLIYYNLYVANQTDTIWLRKADEAFGYITNERPEFQNGKSFWFRGIINALMDTDYDTTFAKQYFDTYIGYVISDTIKHAKDLVIAYDYIASFYASEKHRNYCMAIKYWEKIVALDAKNEKAIGLLKDTKGKCLE